MTGNVQPIPEGQRSVTPHLVIKNAADAMAFYKKAFGMEEVFRMTLPGSEAIAHAEMKFGDSHIYLAEEFPDWKCFGPGSLGGTPVGIHLYVRDVDLAFQRAVEAGAEVMQPLEDMFWGDRYGKLRDPYGHEWSLSTHIRDVSPDEMEEGMKKAMAEMGQG